MSGLRRASGARDQFFSGHFRLHVYLQWNPLVFVPWRTAQGHEESLKERSLLAISTSVIPLSGATGLIHNLMTLGKFLLPHWTSFLPLK